MFFPQKSFYTNNFPTENKFMCYPMMLLSHFGFFEVLISFKFIFILESIIVKKQNFGLDKSCRIFCQFLYD